MRRPRTATAATGIRAYGGRDKCKEFYDLLLSANEKERSSRVEEMSETSQKILKVFVEEGCGGNYAQ